MEKVELLASLDRAIRAEEQAHSFYQTAAQKTRDLGGAAMFQELAAFEGHHRDRLVALRDSLKKADAWIEYKGRDLSKRPTAEAAARSGVDERTDALGALRVAIEAEERAETEYRALASQTADQLGRRMFERLAQEESMHRKLLDDQYYALTNKGVWVWGD